MKRCSLLPTRKMQIKTLRYYYTPIRMTKIKNTIISTGKYVEQLESLRYSCWRCKMVYAFLNMIWQFSINFNILLPYDPAIPLLVMYSREIRISIPTKICTQMFIAALFYTAPNWN